MIVRPDLWFLVIRNDWLLVHDGQRLDACVARQ
jgi:hypothetical protein